MDPAGVPRNSASPTVLTRGADLSPESSSLLWEHGPRQGGYLVQRDLAGGGFPPRRRRGDGGSRLFDPLVLGWFRARSLHALRAPARRYGPCGGGQRHRQHFADLPPGDLGGGGRPRRPIFRSLSLGPGSEPRTIG